MPRLRSRVRDSFPAPSFQGKPSFPFSLGRCAMHWRSLPGGMAEWSCSGLQSRVRRFESDSRLQLRHAPGELLIPESGVRIASAGLVPLRPGGKCLLIRLGRAVDVSGRSSDSPVLERHIAVEAVGASRCNPVSATVAPLAPGGVSVSAERRLSQPGQACRAEPSRGRIVKVDMEGPPGIARE